MRLWSCIFFITILTGSLGAETQEVVGRLRTEPVLPVNLPDYELTTLEVTKEIVFHVGEQTAVGRVPILVYVPTKRSGHAEALDRLQEARSLLIRAASEPAVSTGELAALRDLLERAISSLRDTKSAPAPASSTHAHG